MKQSQGLPVQITGCNKWCLSIYLCRKGDSRIPHQDDKFCSDSGDFIRSINRQDISPRSWGSDFTGNVSNEVIHTNISVWEVSVYACCSHFLILFSSYYLLL